MKKLLNVLYVNTPDVYMSLEGANVVVSSQGSEKFRIPVHNLESIVCFGYMGASPALMGYCAENGVALCFVSPSGKFLARISGRVQGNVLLRTRQYRAADNEMERLGVARNCITGKLVNSRTVIDRAIRDYGSQLDAAALERVSAYLKSRVMRLQSSESIAAVRGIEGDCARRYFSVFNELIRQQKEDFTMLGRNRRPPRDNVNALLSFLYTLLVHDIQSALESVGLDPYVGFLHSLRPGRPALALDLMEELRPYLADRLALSLVNRRQVKASGFKVRESGAVLMDVETRKTVLTAWQKRKQQEITHPYLNEKIPIGLLPYVQAQLMARYLRGDLDEYPPFLWN